jgi:hypothetical protein
MADVRNKTGGEKHLHNQFIVILLFQWRFHSFVHFLWKRLFISIKKIFPTDRAPSLNPTDIQNSDSNFFRFTVLK